jgi:hypothetical protein
LLIGRLLNMAVVSTHVIDLFMYYLWVTYRRFIKFRYCLAWNDSTFVRADLGKLLARELRNKDEIEPRNALQDDYHVELLSLWK